MVFSLSIGGAVLPNTANAGLFSSIFGDNASASVPESISGTGQSDNLQTLSLLQANSATLPIFKADENKKERKDEVSSESNINIVSETALLAQITPASVLGEPEDSKPAFDQISVYVVRSGDTISEIAEMFEVSVNTILWANDLTRKSKIKEGDVLFILPISGIEHTVAKGQTLKSIAKKYDADIEDIASFNGLEVDSPLSVGDKLIIPGGEMNVDGSSNTNTPSKNKTSPTKSPAKSFAGYYINPVAGGGIKTQGLHGKNGIDIAAPIGTALYAAADGKVLLARMGWNGAYGNMVIIEHPNGTKTLYAHMYRISVSTGQSVVQGQVIGSVGNSGRVRAAPGGNGSHLHLEVYGARNPGVDGSWKR